MGACPFCGGSVPEDTLLFGGSCPKCFGEIPGEEAATDPGEQVREAQARSDNRRRLLRTLIPLLLAIPMLGMLFLLAIGFVIWNRDPVVETMVFDEIGEFEYDYAIVSAPDEPEKPERVAARTRPRSTGRAVPAGKASGTAERPAEQKTDEMGVPVVDARRSSGGLSFEGLGVTASRSGEVLSDPDQIRTMLSKKMRAYGRQLKLCYDKRLKVRTELEGRWQASFTVGKDGYPTEVSFKGMDMKDAELEQCLVSTVKRWKFARISRPQPVRKTWRFRR